MPPTAETTSGAVRGRMDRGTVHYAGVPYTAPPVGELRFAPPEAHPGWAGVRDATAMPPACPQPYPPPVARGVRVDCDEDCLLLNVWTPSASNEPRPVLVWFHGGGFTAGATALPHINGARLSSSCDLVVVTVGYRLGLLGWLYLAHIADGLENSGNTGLLDQVAALRWVRDNIGAFGGDPGNVTIAGDSAGGMSVATLLGTPAAAGLFGRAAISSGSASNVLSVDQAGELAEEVLSALGSPDVGALRAMPVEELLPAQERVLRKRAEDRPLLDRPMLPFGPVVDNNVVPSVPLDSLRDGRAADVALLVGTNADETPPFETTGPVVEGRALEVALAQVAAEPGPIADAYLDEHNGDVGRAWAAISTDWNYRLPALELIRAHSAGRSDCFVYRFDWAPTGGRCFHGLEVPFIFDAVQEPGPMADLLGTVAPGLASEMSRSWANFATSGRPGGSYPNSWSPYGESSAVLHWSEPVTVSLDPDHQIRSLWSLESS